MTDSKPIREDIEKIVRTLMIKGYEMGRKQKETPYKYTLNTDSGEKEWKEILSLFSQAMESIIGEDEYPKEVIKYKRDEDFWQTPVGSHYLYGDSVREQQRAELEKRIK